MAKLPDYTQFGTPKFASGFRPLSAGQLDLSAPAKAMSKVAEGIGDVSSFLAKRGAEEEDRKDALNLMESDAGFQDELRAFNNSFDNSTDYENMEADHAKGSSALVDKWASQIKDPDKRLRWKESALNTVRSANQGFHTRAKDGREDKFIADTNASIEKRNAPLWNEGTPPSAVAEASQKTMSDLNYLCENGMISFQKCQNLKSKKAKEYRDQWIKSGILLDANKTFEDVSWYEQQRRSRRMSTTGSVVLQRAGAIKDMHAKSEVAEKAYGFFLSKGLAPYQAAALAGNMAWESGGNPFDVTKNDNLKNSPNSPHSTGIVQWNDRLPAAISFWRKNGVALPANLNLRDPSQVKAMIKMVPLEQQLAFAWHELQTTEKRAFDRVKKARNLDEATAGAIGLHRPKGFTWANPRGGHAFGQRRRIAGMIENGYAVRGGETASGKADVESGKLPPAMSEEDAARFAEMDSLFGESSDAEIAAYLNKFKRISASNDAEAIKGMANRVADTGKLTDDDNAILKRVEKTDPKLFAKAQTAIKGAAYYTSSRFGTKTIGREVPLEEMSTGELTEHVRALKRNLRTETKDPVEYNSRTLAIQKIEAETKKMKALRRADPAASVDGSKDVVAARDMKEFIGSTYGIGQEAKQAVPGELPSPDMALPEGLASGMQEQFTGTPMARGAYAGIDLKAKEQEAERNLIEARLAAQAEIEIPEADRRTITVEDARDLLNYTARSGQDKNARDELKAALDEAYAKALDQVGDEALAGKMVEDAYFLTAKRQEDKKMKALVRTYGKKGQNLSAADEARLIRATIDEENLNWGGSEEAPAIAYKTPGPSAIEGLRNNISDPNFVSAFVRRYGSYALQQALTSPTQTDMPNAPAQQGVDSYGRPETGGPFNWFK